MFLTGSIKAGINFEEPNPKTITLAQSFKNTEFLCFTQLGSTDGNGFQVFMKPVGVNQVRIQTINLYAGVVPFLCYGKWK